MFLPEYSRFRGGRGPRCMHGWRKWSTCTANIFSFVTDGDFRCWMRRQYLEEHLHARGPAACQCDGRDWRAWQCTAALALRAQGHGLLEGNMGHRQTCLRVIANQACTSFRWGQQGSSGVQPARCSCSHLFWNREHASIRPGGSCRGLQRIRDTGIASVSVAQ